MLKTTLMAAVITAAALALPGSASAVPATAALPSIDKQTASNVELVQSRRWKRQRWYYDRGRYGPRFRYRHGPYSHYHGGWWYPRPWWSTPNFAIGIGPGYGYGPNAGYYGYYHDPDYYVVDGGYAEGGYGGGDEHVQWCLNRYRSYDPRTDTFMGYDGYRHRCNGPY